MTDMRILMFPVLAIALIASIACTGATEQPGATSTPAAVESPTPTPEILPPSGPRASGPQVCREAEGNWRSQGLVQLTISPAAPRAGDRVTVTGSGLRAAGVYLIQVSDLEEITLTIDEVRVAEDRNVNATFVMPALGAEHNGKKIGPCLSVTIPRASATDARFVAPLFVHPNP